MPNKPNNEARGTVVSAFGRLAAALLSLSLFATGSSLAQTNSSNFSALGNGAGNIAANNASRISSLLATAGRGGNRADDGHNKISDDLGLALAGRLTGQRWFKPASRGQGNLVDVLILANAGSDTKFAGLRLALTAGGGVYGRNFRSVPGISAKLPPALIAKLAQRTDVWRIVPNRTVVQASSAVELITGADAVRSMSVGGSPLDGTGVGIAFVDSGIMSAHGAFVGNDGTSRVKMSVDFTSMLATPTTPVDSSGYPFQDPYGHGTLVASVAAGRTVGAGSLDSTGVAPNASLYDVRVLDNSGFGDLATTLAGIDWVINNAAANNIKVLNISLGTNSTDSYLTDPLCVRRAQCGGRGHHGHRRGGQLRVRRERQPALRRRSRRPATSLPPSQWARPTRTTRPPAAATRSTASAAAAPRAAASSTRTASRNTTTS